MAEEYRKAAEAAGHKVTLVNVARKKIAGCLACEYCHGKGNGACIQKDDMHELYPLLAEADVLVLAAPIRISPKPGSGGKIECRIDLNNIPEAAEIANLVPSVVVFALEAGSLEITRVTLEPWDLGQELRQPQAAISIGPPSAPTIGVPGFRVITDKLRNFQWPTPLAIHKFRALIGHTPLGVNELTLRPENRAAGFQWPSSYTVLAQYRDGKWQFETGNMPGNLVPAGELAGEVLRLGEFGTGVLASAGNRQLVFGGDESNSGITLLLQNGSPAPDVFSKGLLAEILHWCYLEEAVRELNRVKNLSARSAESARCQGRASVSRCCRSCFR